MAGTRTRKGTQPLKTTNLPPTQEAPESTRTVLPARGANRAASRGAAKADKTSAPRPRQGPALLARLRPVVLLGGTLACVYATVALATYNPLDPSFTRASGSTVTNAAGPVGAWVSDLLFQVLGHGAWVVVPAGLAMALLLAGRKVGGLARFTGTIGLLWATMGIVATAWPARPGVDFPPGGLLGEVSAQNLQGLVGPAGTWIVLVGVALACLPFVAPLRLEDLAARLVGGVEGAAPQVGRAGLSLGRRAVGGVAAAGAAVAERVRVARAEEAQGWPGIDASDEGDEGEEEDLDEDDPDGASGGLGDGLGHEAGHVGDGFDAGEGQDDADEAFPALPPVVDAGGVEGDFLEAGP
ncbi:DNA translocase FtsK 4TM domain-containing protein, partial [Myxococcota bacterium]|nr:DNA translocase FtsK 4TM domain-containing protein [Myxococcota bacterium]